MLDFSYVHPVAICYVHPVAICAGIEHTSRVSIVQREQDLQNPEKILRTVEVVELRSCHRDEYNPSNVKCAVSVYCISQNHVLGGWSKVPVDHQVSEECQPAIPAFLERYVTATSIGIVEIFTRG